MAGRQPSEGDLKCFVYSDLALLGFAGSGFSDGKRRALEEVRHGFGKKRWGKRF
jgi:hypothetical protein